MVLPRDAGWPGGNTASIVAPAQADLSYYPSIGADGSTGDFEPGYGEVVSLSVNHNMDDDYQRPFQGHDTLAVIGAPQYIVDPGVPIDQEFGGEAGRVDRNTYQTGVAEWENRELTGRVVRIRRKPEGAYGPVSGQAEYGVDLHSLLALSIAQYANDVPSDAAVQAAMANPQTVEYLL